VKATIRFDRLDDTAAVYTLTRHDGTTEEIRQPFTLQPAHYDDNDQPIWQWNANPERPTLWPSFDHRTKDGIRVHLFLRAGEIALCPDATVVLA